MISPNTQINYGVYELLSFFFFPEKTGSERLKIKVRKGSKYGAGILNRFIYLLSPCFYLNLLSVLKTQNNFVLFNRF